MYPVRWILLAAGLFLGCSSDSTNPLPSDIVSTEAGTSDARVDTSGDVAVDTIGSESEPDVVQTLSCPVDIAVELQHASVDDLYQKVVAGDDIRVVDVREPDETAQGVIKGALLFPWLSGVLEAQHQDLPTGVPLFVICRSGNRSLLASTFLVEQGHTCVTNVEQGVSAWQAAGYPLEPPP